MVIVFFVLSGYVLALPAVRRGFSWLDPSYYPRRLFRLYVPVVFALILGVGLHELHMAPAAGGSPWLNSQDGTASASFQNFLMNASLLHQGSTNAFTSVIWTLKYEVEFSLLLPAFVAPSIVFRRNRFVSAITALLSIAACYWLMDRGTHTFNETLRLMPVFYLGVLLAFNIDRLRVPIGPWMTLIATLVCATLLTTSYWWADTDSSVAVGPVYLWDVTGACLAVWLCVVSAPANRILLKKPIHWLGSRSYSLYLVHEPIVVAFGFLFVPHNMGWLTLIVGVPVALVVADVFWRLIESPSIRAARWIGLQVARVLSPLNPLGLIRLMRVSSEER